MHINKNDNLSELYPPYISWFGVVPNYRLRLTTCDNVAKHLTRLVQYGSPGMLVIL